MPMKIEAAAVTQKRPSADYNNDSVNINGKVFSREIIKNGYKGSGVVSGDVYFALASSDVDGFADAAVAAFNDNADGFKSQSPESVFIEFFDNCREALKRTEYDSTELVCSNLYASGRKVVVAFNGKAAVYKCSENNCVRISETVVDDNGVNTCVFPDVAAGEIYILVSPGVTATLSDKDIDDICKVSDGSVKRIVNLISKVALSKEGKDAGSAIAVKILETALDTDEVTPAFVPDFSAVVPEETVSEASADAEDAAVIENGDGSNVHTENADAEDDSDMKIIVGDTGMEAKDDYTEMIDEFEEADRAANGSDNEDENEDEDNDSSGLSSKLFIAVGAVIALVVICIVVVFVVRGFGGKEETTTLETTTAEETTEEATTEEDTTEEETSEEETTEEETAAPEETTTRRTTPVVTPAVPTTTQPATTEPATTEPSTTEPSTTEPSTTEPSTTEPSTTEPASTAAPETQSPETQSPETQAPETSAE